VHISIVVFGRGHPAVLPFAAVPHSAVEMGKEGLGAHRDRTDLVLVSLIIFFMVASSVYDYIQTRKGGKLRIL